MDSRSADYLRHRMARFRESVAETRTHYQDLCAFGKYTPSAPYYERSGILLLLQSPETDPETCSGLLQEYRQICSTLEAFEAEKKGHYREILLDELHACTDRYAAAVCHANLGLVDFSTDPDLFCRDRIAVLIHELERDHDLSDLKVHLGVLDANLFTRPGNESGDASRNAIPAPAPIHVQDNRDCIES